MGRLDEVDLSLDYDSKSEALKELGKAQERLAALRLTLGGQIGSGQLGPPVCIVMEGWDASGKGGAIKRLVYPMDPRHVRVSQFAAPTETELRHHFLWRFWPSLPGWGGMAVLDRSWYGRVLVERVERFTKKKVWKRAYKEIRHFEEGLADEGTVIVKMWMHISPDEQLRRFEARAKDPLKQWKLTDEDWRNRERRDLYEKAVEEMFAKTGTEVNPWHVIPGESKRFARVAVIRTVISAIEDGMERWGVEAPSID
jgi:AMP-polyphosphate phosphotransferase